MANPFVTNFVQQAQASLETISTALISIQGQLANETIGPQDETLLNGIQGKISTVATMTSSLAAYGTFPPGI